MDFQKPYLELVLGFIGFKDINSIILEPTLADPGTFSNAIDKANVEAAELARKA
jgi:FMN-dependent NADH-azoreductase